MDRATSEALAEQAVEKVLAMAPGALDRIAKLADKAEEWFDAKILRERVASAADMGMALACMRARLNSTSVPHEVRDTLNHAVQSVIRSMLELITAY